MGAVTRHVVRQRTGKATRSFLWLCEHVYR